MSKDRLYIFDTTLRDGAQTAGIEFSLEDKISVAALVERTGVDYVEGGYPGANPTDTAFFEQKRTRRSSFVAFGMTKRAGVSASNDPGVAALVRSSADAVCFVAKSWDYHVRVALGCSNEDNLESISSSVEAAVAQGWRELVGDAGRCVSLEHFGSSADYRTLFQEFGFTGENVAAAARASLAAAGS